MFIFHPVLLHVGKRCYCYVSVHNKVIRHGRSRYRNVVNGAITRHSNCKLSALHATIVPACQLIEVQRFLRDLYTTSREREIYVVVV